MAARRVDLGGMLDRSAQAAGLLDETGRLVYANRALLQLAGETAKQPASGEFSVPVARPITDPLNYLLALPEDLPLDQARSVVRSLPRGRETLWFTILFLSLSEYPLVSPPPAGGMEGNPPLPQRSGVLVFVQPGASPETSHRAADTLISERVMRLRQQQRQRWGFDAVPARSERMLRLMAQLQLAAAAPTPVCFVGESGTGKRSLAQVVHYVSAGEDAYFASLNARSMPPEVQRQQLLGAPGASGPEARGLLHLPGSGTLVLQHPSSLAPELQDEIVRWQRTMGSEGNLLHSKGTRSRVPCRLMATETLPLEQTLERGRLSEALYNLLATQVIEVPPLRDRRLELPDHCDAILLRLRESAPSDSPIHVHQIDAAALESLSNYLWPGNLRELEVVLEQAVRRSAGNTLLRKDLPKRILKGGSLAVASITTGPLFRHSLDTMLEEAERRLLLLAMEHFRGNKSKAARSLEISRARFHRRWDQLGLASPGELPPAGDD